MTCLWLYLQHMVSQECSPGQFLSPHTHTHRNNIKKLSMTHYDAVITTANFTPNNNLEHFSHLIQVLPAPRVTVCMRIRNDRRFLDKLPCSRIPTDKSWLHGVQPCRVLRQGGKGVRNLFPNVPHYHQLWGCGLRWCATLRTPEVKAASQLCPWVTHFGSTRSTGAFSCLVWLQTWHHLRK